MNPIILTDDFAVKVLLLAVGGLDALKPRPPFDTASGTFKHDGSFWLVVNHVNQPDPTENGYLAVGLPEAVGEDFASAFFTDLMLANSRGPVIEREAVDLTKPAKN